MGRLSLPPNPLLFEILYEPGFQEDRRTVLPYLLRIDAAHILMLAKTGILGTDGAARLLAFHQELTEKARSGEVLRDPERPHRGLFWLYEQQFIQRLGPEVGGAVHVARSRNDINATVARMRARDELLDLLESLADLLAALVDRAGEHAETLMSGFTHLQPAQPSTLGHYLAGVAAELSRSAEWLAAAYDGVNRSPMGAAAGAGTSFPIDREQVAGLLGFSAVIESSADAVASRDYLVQMLAAAAMAGVTLTRLANDFQYWASHAYGFLDWPDDLVSTSSIMPQKRNAFVLENVRGQAVRPAAALANCLMAMKSTPFTNGVEVSAESTAPAWPALQAGRKACRLMTLLVQRFTARPERMRAFLDDAQTTMTALADHLVSRYGLAFRTAHDAVGTLVGELPPGGSRDAGIVAARLEGILARTTDRPLQLDRDAVAAVLDPARCLESARYGGGPAPESVRRQLVPLADASDRLRQRLAAWRQGLEEADRRLAEAVREAARGDSSPPSRPGANGPG